MLARLSDECLLATTLHKACPVITLIVLAALNYFSDKQHSSYCSIETSAVLISSIVSSFDPWQPGVIGWRDFFIFELARNALSLSSWLQSVFLFSAPGDGQQWVPGSLKANYLINQLKSWELFTAVFKINGLASSKTPFRFIYAPNDKFSDLKPSKIHFFKPI